jgi:ornithine carbamoyltransferase
VSHLLAIRDLTPESLGQILDLSERAANRQPLRDKGVALYFEKPSTRTRNSMEMAVVQLGGHPVTIQKEEIGLGTRESAADVARTLACYHSLIAARVHDHDMLDKMAASVHAPVLNMLSATDHPLQALADLLTIRQLLGKIQGARVAYIGDANNVARSLAEGCSMLGAELTVASPPSHGFAELPPGVRQVTDPAEALERAQIVYTDVWVSMGKPGDAESLRRVFEPYQVNARMMALSPQAWFMHCLPARRGEEVADEVIEGERSAVWLQAENRMNTARGAMAWMLGVSP